MAIYRNNLLKEFIRITRALGDDSRVKTLHALKDGELCLCQVVELLGLAQSTVSKHVSILKHAGLIESRKEQRWIYLSLPGRDASPMVRETLKWIFSSLEKDKAMIKVRKEAEEILKMDKETICQRVNLKIRNNCQTERRRAGHFPILTF